VLGRDVIDSETEATFASRLVSRSSSALTASEIGSASIQDGTSVCARTVDTLDVNASARMAMERPHDTLDTLASKGDFIMMLSG
jgi:hypothetical protein